ncbi:universal stress protein [Aeromicrobium duanguangcaii]|uniref:Universal stress protein n=1 Tax=Aeromicrobium duanguangcaii TaxID=2968086 RepID=A0ABY5KH12_9ACTN|nr:universal stress protein [Aeromicrobium duanguangcaii]MCD9154188.1 universal stress protein [Aeromicrobium duanguangcaii]MCL3837924.1 universal stress protein [Aeromicrobium duanguangcaii]UUI68741.1 universal stress protein [Aeromicrobium duanguangcaii]
MAKIVVTGVDNSQTAAAAAHTAAVLASGLGARLHILSAYGSFEAERITHGKAEVLVTTELTAKGVAEDVFTDLRKNFPGLEMTYAPAEGNPADALVKAAEELAADVIVVGNKRVQGLSRILGSIARDVAAHAPCDVYIAHTHQR